jgi:hypothetical protein
MNEPEQAKLEFALEYLDTFAISEREQYDPYLAEVFDPSARSAFSALSALET